MNAYIESLLSFMPELEEYPEYNPPSDVGEVKAVTFKMPSFFGKDYESFAYIGFPKTKEKTVPAVVLVHGALGHAHHSWVRLWNMRGYAAIAIDMEGYYPEKTDMASVPVDGFIPFVYGAYGPFVHENVADSPKNDAMNSMDKPLEEQWMFHSIAKAILGHNILRNDKRVDKVGICGVSWGSVITSLAIGYDTRFDFAVSIYGGGYMLENKGFCGNKYREAKVFGDNYFAEKRFGIVKTPTFFLCAAQDTAFSIDANSLSYEAVQAANGKSLFGIVEKFKHGQLAAMERIEPFIYADVFCKGAKELIGFSEKPKGREVSAGVFGDVLEAKAYYLTAPISFDPGAEDPLMRTGEVPKECACTISGGKVLCDIPDSAYMYYITLRGEREGRDYFVSSPVVICE